MTELKKELHLLCLQFVQQRVDAIVHAIEAAQQAANEETKSSAGDKYETGRAMMQQQTEQNSAQLNEANRLMMMLKNINTITVNERIEAGSVVITNNGKFYIAISAGPLALNGETYMAISPASPLGVKLMGQKSGHEFSLNGKNYQIGQVF